MPPKNKLVLRDNITGITKPLLVRLARKAGINAMNGMMYEHMRQLIKYFTINTLRDVVSRVDKENRNTIKSEDIRATFVEMDKKFADLLQSNDGYNKCKQAHLHGSNKASLETDFYNKQSDCLFIPKLAYKRIVHELIQEYTKSNMKIHTLALDDLQMVVETCLVNELIVSKMLATHAERSTVQ